MNPPQDNLASIDYRLPSHPGEVALDIVTPTFNRHCELIEQGKRIGPQMQPDDRWIIVDDASNEIPNWRTEILPSLESVGQLFVAGLTYAKGSRPRSHVNRARDFGVRAARLNSWIVEIDDHDLIRPECLASIRETIVRGACFVYGDYVLKGEETPIRKKDYEPFYFRERGNPAVGVRAYPAWLYHVAGGYKWRGPIAVGGNEFPAGDYGLFVRMEAFAGGQGFFRVPTFLCDVKLVPASISVSERTAYSELATTIAEAARRGTLQIGSGNTEADIAAINSAMVAERGGR